jgi:hypothetical protein
MTDSLACNGVTLRAFCYAGEHDGFAKSICSSQSSQKSRGRSLVACDNAGKVVGRIVLHPQVPKDLP